MCIKYQDGIVVCHEKTINKHGTSKRGAKSMKQYTTVCTSVECTTGTINSYSDLSDVLSKVLSLQVTLAVIVSIFTF